MPADTVKHTPALPCPFCGGAAEVWRHRDDKQDMARCDDPMCVGEYVYATVEAWSRRAPDPVREKLVEVLVEARETIRDLVTDRSSEAEGSADDWVADIDAALRLAKGEME